MKLGRSGIGVVLGSLLAVLADGADAERKEQMVLVHLRWVSNQVTVVRSEVVQGRIKKRPAEEGTLQVRLADAQGNILWLSALEDPRLRRYEFPDDTQAGRLRQLEKTFPMAEAVLRLPMKPGATEFQLLGSLAPGGVAPAEAGSVPNRTAQSRPLLLRQTLPVVVRATSAAK